MIIFFPLPQLLLDSLSPYPSDFSFFFSLRNQKEQKVKANKNPIRQKYGKPSKIKNSQRSWSLFCVGPLLLGMGPAVEHGCHTQRHSVGDSGFPLSQQISSSSSFLVAGGTLCPLQHLRAGVLSGLNQSRSYTHHLYLLCLEDRISLGSESLSAPSST